MKATQMQEMVNDINAVIHCYSRFRIESINYDVEPETKEKFFRVQLNNGFGMRIPIEKGYMINYDSLIEYLKNMEKGVI